MATYTGTRGGPDFPVHQGLGTGLANVAYGSYTFTGAPVLGDIIQLCRIPAGAVVVGVISTASAGTYTIGTAANGVEAAAAASLGDAATRPFSMTAGPLAYSAETIVQATVTGTPAAGTIYVLVFYAVPS